MMMNSPSPDDGSVAGLLDQQRRKSGQQTLKSITPDISFSLIEHLMVMTWGAAHGLGRKAWGARLGARSLGAVVGRGRWARIVGHGWCGVVGSGTDCFTSSSPPKLTVLSTLTLFFEPVSVR
jgi:hypothetical protein